MASVIKNPCRTWHVQVRIEGSYKKIYGFRNKRSARVVGEHIEELKVGKKVGVVDRNTRAWVIEIQTSNPDLYDKLASWHLVEPRCSHLSIEQLLQWYTTYAVGGRTPKANTTRFRRLAMAFALRTFGNMQVDVTQPQITQEAVSGLLDQLRSYPSVMTARQYFSVIRAAYANGVRQGKVKDNPFEGVKLQLESSECKEHFFVTEEIAYRVLNTIEDPCMRALWSLARWGGIRMPSEAMHMIWDDLDFKNRRIYIREPKKTSAHRQSRSDFSTRDVPMFPELYKALTEYRDSLPHTSGLVFLLPQWNKIRTYFNNRIRKAGLTPWPKLFNSLRASRDTELQKRFDAYVVSKWLGHTIEISQKFYVQVTDDDFIKATLE